MRITNVLFGLMLLLCVACDKSEKETPNGFKFTVLRAGDGKVGNPGDVIILDVQLSDSKDSIWSDTYKEGNPMPQVIGDSANLEKERGMMQMLRMFSKNDSVSFSIPLKELLAGQPPIPQIDSTLIMTYRVTVRDIMSKDQFRDYRAKLMLEQKEKQLKEEEIQLKEDIVTIDTYLTEKNIVAEKTESGLRYVITQPGKGENGKPGQVAKVNYSGYLLDGQYFDSSDKSVAEQKGIYNARSPYAPLEVTIDQTRVIKGWHEALKLLNKGAKVTVYIPSTLAYGPQQKSEIIKPNSILVFDMEVLDLK